jgi:hypothetical protein
MKNVRIVRCSGWHDESVEDNVGVVTGKPFC